MLQVAPRILCNRGHGRSAAILRGEWPRIWLKVEVGQGVSCTGHLFGGRLPLLCHILELTSAPINGAPQVHRSDEECDARGESVWADRPVVDPPFSRLFVRDRSA